VATEESDKKNIEPVRGSNGQFLPGKSGNPKGKLPGTKSQITLARALQELELREHLKPFTKRILTKAIEMALDGDRSMIKLLLDKAIPNTTTLEDEGTQVEKLQFFIGRLPERKEEVDIIDVTPTEVN
jgi:Family of unknown function (DUF5681)